jgi:hypothetical protein
LPILSQPDQFPSLFRDTRQWVRWFSALLVLILLAACGGSADDPPPVPRATLVLGPQETCARDIAATLPDVTVYGASAGDYLADRFSLATGDFNDDGFADALVGAPLADGPADTRENAGEAYIIFGSAEPTAIVDLALGAPVTIIGENPGDNLGFTVASGDVNGDGRDDAIVGARFAAAGQDLAAGKAYVFFGGEDISGAFDTAAGDQDATVIGRKGDYLTIALATGDVNRDDIDDLLLGASGASGRTATGNRRRRSRRAGRDGPGVTDLRQGILLPRVQRGLQRQPNHLAGDVNGDRVKADVGAPLVDGSIARTPGRCTSCRCRKAAGAGSRGRRRFPKITGGAEVARVRSRQET